MTVVSFRDLFDAGVTAWQKGNTIKPDGRSDLQKALKAEKVFVVLTSKQRRRLPVATHSHMHSMPTLANDIVKTVLADK